MEHSIKIFAESMNEVQVKNHFQVTFYERIFEGRIRFHKYLQKALC